jgi:hypothetical protein
MKRFMIAAVLSLVVVDTGGQESATTKTTETRFYWSSRKAQEMPYEKTIATSADLNSSEKAALVNTIAALVRPFMADNDIKSETELHKLVEGTRLKLIDLNGDGKVEVIAQALDVKVGCGATGNCAFWVFEKNENQYRLLLDTRGPDGIGGIELFTLEPRRTNGFNDLVLAAHDSASEKTLYAYRYKNDRYQLSKCYNASWVSTHNGTYRELKYPEISVVKCTP